MKSSDTRRRRFKRFYRRVIAFIDRGVHFRRIDSELGRRERKPVKLLGICRDRLVPITADGFNDLYGSTIDVFFYVALCGHKFFELCLKIIDFWSSLSGIGNLSEAVDPTANFNRPRLEGRAIYDKSARDFRDSLNFNKAVFFQGLTG